MNRAIPMTWSPSAGGEKFLDYESLEEGELIRRAGPKGDPSAFAELVRRNQGKVRGLLLRLTGRQALTDDLAQEVFLRAYRGLGNFEGRSRLSTWLYRITYNVFLSHQNRSRDVGALPEGFDAKEAAPESAMSASRFDLRRDLDGAIARLPENYRAVITLYYLRDVSYPEIAEVLDMPLGTVKTHLHRAKKALRGELSAWDGGGLSG